MQEASQCPFPSWVSSHFGAQMPQSPESNEQAWWLHADWHCPSPSIDLVKQPGAHSTQYSSSRLHSGTLQAKSHTLLASRAEVQPGAHTPQSPWSNPHSGLLHPALHLPSPSCDSLHPRSAQLLSQSPWSKSQGRILQDRSHCPSPSCMVLT